MYPKEVTDLFLKEHRLELLEDKAKKNTAFPCVVQRFCSRVSCLHTSDVLHLSMTNRRDLDKKHKKISNFFLILKKFFVRWRNNTLVPEFRLSRLVRNRSKKCEIKEPNSIAVSEKYIHSPNFKILMLSKPDKYLIFLHFFEVTENQVSVDTWCDLH